MRFDRKQFFDGIKDRIDATLDQQQVNGLEFLLTAIENDPIWTDIRHIAYALATTFHETAGSFQPVEEGYYLGSKAKVKAFQKTLRYYPYYGRGYVQLTWETVKIPNYSKVSKALGIDFVKNPDLVMKPEYAYSIMAIGMHQGWFTGKKFSNYISGSKCDYVGARRIINGDDKAGLITGYAKSFEQILRTTLKTPAISVNPHSKPQNTKPTVSAKPSVESPVNSKVEISDGNITAETNAPAPPNVIVEKEAPIQEVEPKGVFRTLKGKVVAALTSIGGINAAIEYAKQGQTLGISNDTWNVIFWLILSGIVLWIVYYFFLTKVLPRFHWLMSRLKTQELIKANTNPSGTVEVMALTDDKIAELTKQGYVIIRRG